MSRYMHWSSLVLALLAAASLPSQGRGEEADRWLSSVECQGRSECRARRSLPTNKIESSLVHGIAVMNCAGVPVRVAAASSDEHRLACDAAGIALKLMSACDIGPKRSITLRLQGEISAPLSKSEMLGLFDTERDLVLVVHLDRVPGLIKDTPFARLPVRDTYTSIVVHEVIHALIHQNLIRPLTNRAAIEYPAFALQIESLPPNSRAAYLASFSRADVEDNKVSFNDITLMLDPFLFAARAYHHFKSSANPCSLIANIMKASADFIFTIPEGF